MSLVIDIIFTVGTSAFLLAGLRQLKRVYKTKSTNGVSLTHYHVKVFASSCMILGYTLSGLPISVITSLIDFTIIVCSIRLVTKYRHIGFFSG